MCCQQGGTGTVCCQLSVFAWCSHLWGGATGKRQRVWISAHKGVASLFSPLSPSASGGERCWLFFFFSRCFCLVASRMAFWETRAGRERIRSAASSVGVFPSPVFTFCLFAEQETWTPLLFLSSRSSLRSPFVRRPLLFEKLNSDFIAVLIDLTVPTRGRFYVLQDQNSCQQFLLVCVKSGIIGTYWSYELDQKETLCSSQLFYRLSPIWSFYGWIFITCSE